MAGRRKAALLVGIDGYEHKPELTCVADARRMHRRLSTHVDGRPNFECTTLVDPPQPIERHLLLETVDRLFSSKVDVALLYFTGHGGVDAYGGYVFTRESRGAHTGVRMSEILAMANASKIEEIVMLFDCCSANAFGAHEDLATLRGGLSLLTAAEEDETARVGAEGALFTSVLCDALDGGAADVRGHVTVASTYAYVDESFGTLEQRPELKAHVSQLIPLRECQPAVPHQILRQLPRWFPQKTNQHDLSPAYEPTAQPSDPEREAIFGALQKCRAAKLVEPVGFDHMYDAAMAGGACRLTALGRHYRDMALAKRL